MHAKTSVSTAGQSFDDNQPEAQSSPTSTTSPRESSTTSPTEELPQFPSQMHRQLSNIHYMSQGHSHNTAIPPHMRNEYSMNMNGRHNHIPTTSSNTYPNIPPHNQHQHQHQNQHQLQMQRLSITSNPTAHTYAPPQPLEPPPTNGNIPGTVSTTDSPHLTTMAAWPSPNPALPSPSTMDFSSYPDPGYNAHMFYPSNNIRRPQSTEPEDWSLRSRQHHQANVNSHTHYGNHMQLSGEWNVGIPMNVNVNVNEVKGERAYAM